MVGGRLSAVILQTIAVLFLVGHGHGILVKSQCTERNLQVTCECSPGYQTLTIGTYIFDSAHSTIHTMIVKNCKKVTVFGNAIKDLRNLRHLLITNIEDLQLEANSLTWQGYNENYMEPSPSIEITISNSRIREMPNYTIKGTITELHLNNVLIERIQAYAFSSVSQLLLVEIKNSTIKQVQAQAFKKFQTEKLIISDTDMGTMPSRSFSDVEVTENFRITNCHFDTVKPSAFIIKYPKSVEILGSQFDNLEGDSFRIFAKGPVSIKNNQFRTLSPGAFTGISLIKEYRQSTTQELLFANNTLNELKKESLQFNRTSFTPKYGPIILNKTCTCADVQMWLTNSQWEEYVQCVIDNRKLKTIRAVDFNNDQCSAGSTSWVIIISVIAALLVFLIIVGIVIFIVYKRYKEQKQKEYVNRGRTKNGSLGLIIPDGRTYRETEVHVIVEKAELLTTEL